MARRKKHQLTEIDVINWWMTRYHGITIEEAYEKEPWDDSHDFYARYPVTTAQHDEWHEWMIDALAQDSGMSKKYVRKYSWSVYLNTSPTTIKEE